MSTASTRKNPQHKARVSRNLRWLMEQNGHTPQSLSTALQIGIGSAYRLVDPADPTDPGASILWKASREFGVLMDDLWLPSAQFQRKHGSP